MILSALLSFLGGSSFRMVWGEVAAFLNKRQEHEHELEALKAQSDLEAARAERDMARLRLQSDLGVKEVQIQADAALSKTEAEAFVEAMKASFKPTGIIWVDTWNGVIRPSAATIALVLWALKLYSQGFVMDEWDKEITGAVLGFFFADRALARRGR